VAGGIRLIKQSNDLIGNRIFDLPACTVVQEPTMLPHAPDKSSILRGHTVEVLTAIVGSTYS
jgi:hypothetical protein